MWDKLFPPIVFLDNVTNAMVRSLFREVDSFSACQEVRILCNPNVNFRVSPCILTVNHFYYRTKALNYTGCPRRNGQNFGRVFLMLNYTDITQNTYIQSWTVTEIMAWEKCGFVGCPRTVRRPWCHTRTVRMPGNETPLANIVMQWPWRDNSTAAACVNYLET